MRICDEWVDVKDNIFSPWGLKGESDIRAERSVKDTA